MDFTSQLGLEELHTLRTISRHDEINEWLSAKVDIHIIRAVPGGFGTVYCVVTYLIALTFSCRNVAPERYQNQSLLICYFPYILSDLSALRGRYFAGWDTRVVLPMQISPMRLAS